MRFWGIIALIVVLSALGLTYEIAAGRVLAPFFGTSLVTWTTVIAVVLAGFSIGAAWGGLLAERPRPRALAANRTALIAAAATMALSPTALGLVHAMGARGTGGMALATIVAFLPASVLVTLPSALLAKMAVEARPRREGSSLGLVLAAGSVGAILGAVGAGFVLLPGIGSAATFALCGALALACALTLGRGGALPAAAAAVVVVAQAASGPVCRHESGLSCLDVRAAGGAVVLTSDRVRQAAERPTAEAPGDRLGLPYTRWIWARMRADLPAGAHVLFVGGGGYTLPAALLAADPAARATVVEIDPLVTAVARAELPFAGGWIDRERGGRLRIVHADGRTVLNRAEARYDAAVMDAFSSGAVPAHLATLEAYERLAAIVDGPVYVNLLDAPDGPLAAGVHAVLAALWPEVRAVHGPVSARGRANVLLAASEAPLGPVDLPARYGAAAIPPARAFTDDRGWTGHR